MAGQLLVGAKTPASTSAGVQSTQDHGGCTSAQQFLATGATNPLVQAYFGLDTTNDKACLGSGWSGHANPELLIAPGGDGASIVYEHRVSKTGAYTLSASLDGGTQFDNNGASGIVVLTLLTAAQGLRVNACVAAAQTLELLAVGSATINAGCSVSSAAGNITSAQVGACIQLQGVDATHWLATGVTGSGGSTAAGGWTVH